MTLMINISVPNCGVHAKHNHSVLEWMVSIAVGCVLAAQEKLRCWMQEKYRIAEMAYVDCAGMKRGTWVQEVAQEGTTPLSPKEIMLRRPAGCRR